ncbi:hypothetical protein TWF694_006102 [Orbilia ellipsospora]|uniref:Uncharacterized protein n=1 Tax=Orbilia ellipsospora TaxID=2528407 RepID=A0AAV9WSN6_9PEZI
MPESMNGANGQQRLILLSSNGNRQDFHQALRSPSPMLLPPAASPESEDPDPVNSHQDLYEVIDDNAEAPRAEFINQLSRPQGSDSPLLRFEGFSFLSISDSSEAPSPKAKTPRFYNDDLLDLSSMAGVKKSNGVYDEAPTSPIPPPAVLAFGEGRPYQLPWDEMKVKMKFAYDNQMDNETLDCLLIQDYTKFLFFDIKWTHIGDYLEINFARVPTQICIIDFKGNIIYQANLAMFDPRNGKEILDMHQWVCLIEDYLYSGAMSRRWYDERRLQEAIHNMRGYFWSKEIPRKNIWRIKEDLKRLRLRHKILFTHDGNLRPYDLLRKLLSDTALPPRLLTMSTYKLIKLILPDMPRTLYEFYTHIVDFDTFNSPENPVLRKHTASDDANYVREIVLFFIRAWESFQREPGGRPLHQSPTRLVDCWEGFPYDSPLFEPLSDSDGDSDCGFTLDEVEAYDKEKGLETGDGSDSTAGPPERKTRPPLRRKKRFSFRDANVSTEDAGDSGSTIITGPSALIDTIGTSDGEDDRSDGGGSTGSHTPSENLLCFSSDASTVEFENLIQFD